MYNSPHFMEASNDGPRAIRLLTGMVVLAMVIVVSCHKRTVKTNATVVEDSAIVVASIPIEVAKKTKKKKLYITFDDGPNKGSRNVLDIVKDEKVPVSFFVVGEHVFASKSQRNVWDSLSIAEHIAICNHSYTHAHNKYTGFYQDPEGVVKDFKRTEDSLNLTNKIVRTPGRNIWRIDSLHFTDLKKSKAAADSLQRAGYIVMGWDVEWHYNPKTFSVTSSADEVIRDIDSIFAKRKTINEDQLVLLAHDQVYQKPDDSIQLRRFLQQLKLKDEYELALVTTYPASNRQDTFKIK
jgi:peptidoglycan/xylan/chitin deacetylase (PgdA/CDA1 family)